MNENNILKRSDDFLCEFRKALKLPSPQADKIVDEVSADLLDHVRDHTAKGMSEAKALDVALEDLGDPVALARTISETAKPEVAPWLTPLRYLAVGVLGLWAIYFLWNIRAWNYGFSPLTTVVGLAFHLSILLLIWPKCVWRKNWLFGLIPAGISLLILIILCVMGTSSAGDRSSFLIGTVPLCVLIFLILNLQRRRQRIVVIAVAVLVVSLVEIPFLVEESNFRKIRDSAQASFDESRQAADGETFSIHWSRPLSPEFSICYSAAEDKIWIND